MGTGSGLNRPRQGTLGSSHGRSARFQAGSKKERRKLVALLDSLYRRRLILKEKRNEIREERLYLDGLEAKLLGSISRSLTLGAALDHSLIQDLHTEIIAKKDELGGLQYEYDQAEEDYDAAEAVLVEQEDIENGNFDHYDVAIQSSHVESEASASDHGLRSNNLEELNRQQSKQAAPTFQNLTDYRIASGKDEFNRNSNSGVVPTPKVEGSDSAEKKDSSYDILEATFKMRVTSPPVGETQDDIPFGFTSRKSKKGEGEVSIRNDIKRWESMSHPGSIRHADSAPRGTQYLDSGRKIGSDSGVTTRRKGLIRRRSRVIWWLFNTFGSSGISDYLERTRDKQQLSSSKHLDDETWARYVFGHWTHKRIPAAVPVTAAATSSTGALGATHVEDQSLGGSYLLLPSGPIQLRHSVENVDRLFADTVVSPRNLSQQTDLADELSSMLPPARSL